MNFLFPLFIVLYIPFPVYCLFFHIKDYMPLPLFNLLAVFWLPFFLIGGAIMAHDTRRG